jgi:crotonobetainyl-CoA:carnitine CoA-transferase CaiB-like acyl-CoA transferase
MTDGAAALNIMTAAAYLVDGREPGREDWFLNGGSLYDFYETADREYLSFGGLEPKFFEAFCRAVGLPDLIPGGVAPADIEQVKAQVRDIIKGKTLAEWMEIFEETEACLEPVLSLGQALDQPQARARGWAVEVPGPRGPVRQPAPPLKFSRTPPEYRAVGVPAGAHTREVMLGLGFGEDEIKDLEQEGLFS